jgi:hypothetical protein
MLRVFAADRRNILLLWNVGAKAFDEPLPFSDLTTNQIRPGTGVAQQISVKPVELFFDPITDNAVISYCDLNLMETGAKDPHQTS